MGLDNQTNVSSLTTLTFRDQSSKAAQVLHVTARHTPESLVAVAANQLIKEFSFPYNLKERNLWAEDEK